MSVWSKDRGTRSLSISPAIASTSPLENAGTTPANPGNATGAGDVFAYIPSPGQSFQHPVQLSWDVRVRGAGTYTALAVNLEGSDNNSDWDIIDTINSPTGGQRMVPATSRRFYRCNATTVTVSTGTPTFEAGITL